MNITIRPGRPEDASACGTICFEAFTTISRQHNFPPDIPSPQVATAFLSGFLSHKGVYSVVAEMDGRVVGSNFMLEFAPIAGIGPISVAPSAQNSSVGRRLMEDAMERYRQQRFAGVRLLQAAFHGRSLALYTKLGFKVREPLAVLQGPAMGIQLPGYTVRRATKADVAACNRVCLEVHGHDRGLELVDAIDQGTARLVERGGRTTGYATGIGFFSHAVAETNGDLQALIAAAREITGPGLILPTRNSDLFRWCLEKGLRVMQPMTLMSHGLYNEPSGAFMPSILY
ncbi:MAG: hypothetical protein JWR26_4852 [Pedosphaera sp.]|nr:hypothetical protein [Pedosphaera sp.]